MSNIYKFHHIYGSDIKKTYTFNDITASSTQAPLDTPSIYNDDMIINIKHKLTSLFDNQSHNEVYLFCKSKHILNQSIYYSILTQDDNLKLNKSIFERFVSNIALKPQFLKTPNDISTKHISTFYKSKTIWSNTEKSIITPIGVSAFYKKRYIFNHNPFFLKETDKVIEEDMKRHINTENKQLLFKYKPEDNEIYFCFADELLTFFKDQQIGIPERYILELYFPNLTTQQIVSLDDLQSKKTALKSQSEKEYEKTFSVYNSNIDLLHNYSIENIENLQYKINNIYFTIRPAEPLKLPLDIMFKRVNSTDIIPLIKLNPGKDLESIYRLYTGDYLSDKGRKIPTLFVENHENSRKIKNISEAILYNNRIGFYLDLKHAEIPINEELFCIVLSNGDIQIKLDPKNNYTIETIEVLLFPIIKKYIIDVVNVFIHKKNIYYFKSLTSNNIELNKFDVSFYTDDISDFSFKNLKCTSSVFSVLSRNKKDNKYDLKYKRVSFYQKMNDIQSFISLKIEEGIPIQEIKHMIMNNFNLSQEDTADVLNNFLKEARLQTDAFDHKKLKIENNSGFDIHIETKNTDYTNIKIKQIFHVKHINDFAYISNDIIKKYINSLINLNTFDSPIEACAKVSGEEKIDKIADIHEAQHQEQLDTELTFDDDEDDDDFGTGLMSGLMSGILSDSEEEAAEEEAAEEEAAEEEAAEEEAAEEEAAEEEAAEDAKKDSADSTTEDSIEAMDDLDDLPESLSGSLSGGDPTVDLTSISLKGRNNWFTNRLKTRDKDLFVLSREEQKNKNYLSYSRSCPWQHKRQPVIVDDDELKKIESADKKSKSKSFDGLIKYRGYNYICPRYWCFKDDNNNSRSISFQQINDGECGGWDAVNPPDAKKLLKGKRIIELTDDKLHNSSKSNNPLIYKPLFPVVQNPDKHPKGLCAPCCFKEPIEYDGFPEDSQEIRNQKNDDQEKFFKHLYEPGKQQGVIKIDDALKDDEKITQLAEKWKGVGPSFTIKKKGKNIVITDIVNNDSKKIDKIDMIPIPKNKKTQTFTRKDIDLLLQKKATNERYQKCMGKKQINPVQIEGKDTPELESLSDENGRDDDDRKLPAPKKPTVKKTDKKKKTLILKSLKFPLDTDEFGYIKPSLKKFIQYNTESMCYNNPPRDSTLKPDASCLLRLGIKRNDKQSFLQNIARIKDKKLATFKKILTDRITISKFIMAFKGELINIFYDNSKKVNKKKENHLIKSIEADRQQAIINEFISVKELKDKLINSYFNFIDYINDDNNVIDYSYLWDFICKPYTDNESGVLFETGINMVIFNSPQNDMTDKIEIICPKHTFSDEIFSEFKPTVMLYKEGVFFEPIVLYDNKNSTTQILFDYDDLMKDTMIGILFSDIKNKIVEGCSLKPSMPQTYDFNKNISAKQLIEKISTIQDAVITKQIIHYNFTTIAIIAKIKDKNIYIPCHPSPIIIDLDYEYFDSKNVLFDAYDTFNLLVEIAKTYDIPCHPLKVLVSDQINVVGFITETNQLVPTNIQEYDQDLFAMKTKKGELISIEKSVINIDEHSSYFSDKEILKSSAEEIERNLVVRNFLLEKNFYTCFRNMFKKYINSESNGVDRQKIIDLLDTSKVKSSDTLKQYKLKFDKIKKLVEKINNETISFVIYQDIILNNLYEQVRKGNTICFNGEDSGEISLPRNNLIDDSDNSEKYVIKIVDELIRFPRLKNYILYNKSISSIDVIEYSVNKQEVIILEEELNDYLTDVVLKESNEYVKTNQVGFTKPIKTKKYKTTFRLNYDTAEKDQDDVTVKRKSPKLLKEKDDAPADEALTDEAPADEAPADEAQVDIATGKEKEGVAKKDTKISSELSSKINVDKYVVDSSVGRASHTCKLNKSSNKSVIGKLFNNYLLNKSIVFYKMSSPVKDELSKTNCTWNVFQEIYLDYTTNEISKQEICYSLLHILIQLNNEDMFITKPGQVSDTPNYYHILDLTYRRKFANIWNGAEGNDDRQWKHLFNIISDKAYYLIEFEFYLLCEFFKIPCIIHGTTDNSKSQYKISNIEHYDPLYTTYNTSNLNKKIGKDVITKNNLYTNKNKEPFCYIIGFKQFLISDYYDKHGNRNNMGINKYYRKDYNIPFDIGLMKTTNESYRIDINKQPIKELLAHSISPSIKQYIDVIFKQKTNELTIYESFKREIDKFRTDKNNKKVKIVK